MEIKFEINTVGHPDSTSDIRK